MLTLLISLFSSSGVGSILGLAGGLINRWMDQKNKKADQDFELKKLDKEREFMKDEYASRLQITVQEGEAAAEVAGYEAMTKSYDFARTSSEDGLVDKFSKGIRPFLTLAFFFFTVLIFYKVSALVTALELKPSTAEVWEMYIYIIQWIFFQAGAAIGWWFAMRPGKSPTFVSR